MTKKFNEMFWKQVTFTVGGTAVCVEVCLDDEHVDPVVLRRSGDHWTPLTNVTFRNVPSDDRKVY